MNRNNAELRKSLYGTMLEDQTYLGTCPNTGSMIGFGIFAPKL